MLTSTFIKQLHSVGGDGKKVTNILIRGKDLVYDAFSHNLWDV